MKSLMDALMSKKQDKMDPNYKSAKLGILEQIKNLASGEMGNDVQGLKKVTVAAPNAEALESGLATAKEMIGGEGSDGAPPMSDQDEDDLGGDMSNEEIDMMIKALEAKKSKQI